jgi:uncharacterized protein (TIGR02270 family)
MESAASSRTPLLWDLVEESLEEAEFLWERWESMLDAPDRDLDGIWFWVEERLQGALDGVLVGGEAAIEPLLIPALASDSPGRVTAATCVLTRMATPTAIEAVTRAVEGFVGPPLDAVVRGLGRVASPELVARLGPLLDRGGPASRAAILTVHHWRRLPVEATLLRQCLSSPEKEVRAAALTVARHSPAPEVAALVEWGLRDDDQAVSAAAIETGLVINLPSASERLVDLVHELGNQVAPPLLTLFAFAGTDHALRVILGVLEDAPARADILAAVQVLGRRACIEALLAKLQAATEPLHAKLVGDAISGIAGVRLHEENLLKAPEAALEPPSFEADDLDADLVPPPGEELPEPDGTKLLGWWEKNQARFPEGPRFMRGSPATTAGLVAALATAPMRRRHPIALELAIRSGGALAFETRAFINEQRQQLAKVPDHAGWGRAPVPGWVRLP